VLFLFSLQENFKDMSQPSTNIKGRTVLIALISAISPILIAFIGIVPELRKKDQKEIATQQSTIDTLNKKVNSLFLELGKKCSIVGKMVDKNNVPIRDAEIYASLADNQTIPDNTGTFGFTNMIPGASYRLILIYKKNNIYNTYTLTIGPDDDLKQSIAEGLIITYDFKK
jgi:hypothetical protein